MPVYEYLCKKCGARFERRATVREYEEKKEVPCPRCGFPDDGRVWSRVTVLGPGTARPPGAGSGCGPTCGPGCGT